MLLDHGADVNAQCSGLCDCAVPDLSGKSEVNSSVAPHHDRSVWTPLHVAMCTGNADAARLLIARGASALVGSLIRQSYGVDRKSRLSMNAFQNAAWMGSVPMCQILLVTPRFGQYLNRLNLKSQTALHYAAAGGNIRTVGKLLLQNGATYDDYGGGGLSTRDDPLRLLCKHGKYEDARWLIHFCLDLYQGRGLDPRRLYTRVLAAVCDLRPHTAYNRLSLRAQQDQLYSMTAQDIANLGKVNWQEVERSGLNRVTLAITLLSFGADVNRTQEVVDPQDHRRYRTPLQIAASSQFHQMVEVLLGHGADHNKIGINPFPFPPNQQQDVADLPLMLAIASALSGPRKGKLAATQILDRGTSLADIGPQQQSVLAKLQALLWNGEGGYCDFLARDAVWAYFAQLLLHYGAAAATSQRNWEAIVASACVPTNLEYCRLLEQWRPIAGFSEGTLVEMMRGALFGCGDWAEQRTPEDVELVKWVLGHCRKSGGFVAGPLRDAVLGLAETALRGGREVTGTAVVVGM
jgi:ankyrin repeat protein